jgi:signal recognition particle subunit SRP54
MVVDAMTGQDAVNVAAAFATKVDFDGVIMSKLDGDARGGAALSIRQVTGKPIKFASFGEKTDALEVFHPDRMAKRILGMGDVISLIEKAQEVGAAEVDAETEARLRKADFTLDDFLTQITQVRKMGGVGSIIKSLPGASKLGDLGGEDEDGALDQVEAIIFSMTAKERAKPNLINGSRRERIARGAGVQVYDVNQLLKQFTEARKLMKQFQGMSGKGKKRMRLPGMPGGF